MTGSTYSAGESIECPACGEWIGDLWDYGWSDSDETLEIECGDCGAHLHLQRTISVDYAATLVEA